MAGNARSKAPTPRVRPRCPWGSWLLLRLRRISEKRLGLWARVHLVLHTEVCQAASKRMVCPAPGQPPGPPASCMMIPKMDTEAQEVQGGGARRVFMVCREYKPHRWWLYVHADDRMWYVGPTVEIRALAVGYAATPSWWNTHKLGKLSAEAAERERAWCLLLKCYYFQADPIDSRDVATD